MPKKRQKMPKKRQKNRTRKLPNVKNPSLVAVRKKTFQFVEEKKGESQIKTLIISIDPTHTHTLPLTTPLASSSSHYLLSSLYKDSKLSSIVLLSFSSSPSSVSSSSQPLNWYVYYVLLDFQFIIYTRDQFCSMWFSFFFFFAALGI